MTSYRNQYTYGACSAAFTPGATPQDVFTITGNATTNVYVLKMGLSTTQTTEGINAWFITKRSTANSGGTSGGLTAVSFNVNNPAAAATILKYTGNPTAGTLVGNIWSGWVNSPKAATAGVSSGFQGVEVSFQDMFAQPICLLSANDVLAWNFGGNALPTGLSVYAYCLWIESPKS